MRLNLDLLEGEREKTIIRVASYQQQLKSYYDRRAKVRQFQPGDLVLRKAFITAPRQGSKKMNPNWEGPYVISRSGGRGSYTLDTMDGKQIPRQWNVHHLRNFSFQNVFSAYKIQIVAHKQRPKGDAGRRPKRHSRDAARKKRSKGDAGCVRNFLKGGLHAFCGKYPGSYPFPKGGRIDTQLPISSVIRETQGDDQSVIRETQPGRQDRHTVAHKQRPSGDARRRPRHPKGCAEYARSLLRGALALANFLRETILRDAQDMPGAS
ncbi:unnamed protein product [Prunus armeniaca]